MRCFQIEAFGKPLLAADQPIPTPTGTEVVVRTTACGVCHSDVHIADGYFDLGGGNRIDLSRGLRLPLVPGHEVVGEVVALGPDVAATMPGIAVGDRRVVYPWIGCGQCAFCSRGHEELCDAPRTIGVNRDGGYGGSVMVPHPRYLFEYAPLPDEQACILACSGLTAFGALRKVMGLPPDAGVLIIGAGGVGLSAIRLAKHVLGIAPVVAEIDRSRWDIALEAGAADVVDPSDPGTARALMKATGGGMAAVLDFVGAGPTFAFGMSVLRKAGTLVVVGLLGGDTTVSPAVLPLKAITVVGSYVGSLAEMGELMRIARAGALPPMPVQERGLDEANAVLDQLRAGQLRGRAVLRPSVA